MKVKKAVKLSIVLGLITVLASGCFGGVEVNQRAFVQLMGIDKSDDMYVVNIQLYHSQSGTGEPDITMANSKTVDGTGPTIFRAIEDAEKKQGKQFFLGHIKLLIIGRNLDAPADELGIFLDSGITPGCPVVYSDDPSGIVATELKDGAFSAEYLLKLMNTSARHGETVYTPLKELTSNVSVLGLSCVLPVISSDGQTISFNGLTFLKDNKVITGYQVSENDVLGVKLLMDDYSNDDRVNVPVTVGGKTATALIIKSDTDMKTDIFNDSIRLKAEINISVQIIENPYGIKEGEIEKAVRENLRDTVISAYSTAVWYNKCDVFNIYKIIRKYNPGYLSNYGDDMLENSILDVKIYDRVIG